MLGQGIVTAVRGITRVMLRRYLMHSKGAHVTCAARDHAARTHVYHCPLCAMSRRCSELEIGLDAPFHVRCPTRAAEYPAVAKPRLPSLFAVRCRRDRRPDQGEPSGAPTVSAARLEATAANVALSVG